LFRESQMRPKLMALLLALAAAPAALAQAPSETPTAALLKSDAARLPLNPFDKDAIGALDWGRIAQSPAWRSASTVGLGAQAIPPFPWRFVKQITGRFAGVQFQATLQASKADAGWYRVALHTDRDTGEICDLVKAQLLSLYGPPTAHGHSDYALHRGRSSGTSCSGAAERQR
jgi:hypothetical protein